MCGSFVSCVGALCNVLGALYHVWEPCIMIFRECLGIWVFFTSHWWGWSGVEGVGASVGPHSPGGPGAGASRVGVP